MADTLKRIYFGQPGTAAAAAYTAPSTGTIIRTIHVNNTTATAATISLGINGTPATAANAFYSAFSIPPNGIHVWNGNIYLGSADTIWASQGSAASLTVVITGVEQ